MRSRRVVHAYKEKLRNGRPGVSGAGAGARCPCPQFPGHALPGASGNAGRSGPARCVPVVPAGSVKTGYPGHSPTPAATSSNTPSFTPTLGTTICPAPAISAKCL